MDSFANEKDFALFSRDCYTFAVLSRILRGQCDLILSNHENLIMCQSESRFPVWIWTPDNASYDVKENAWNLVCALRPLSEKHRFNLKYDLAEYFIAKAAEDGVNAGISTNLFAYDCPAPKQPNIIADGELHRCTMEDVEEAADILPLFYAEIGDEIPPRTYCLEKAKSYITRNAFFFWKNDSGKTVACCSYGENNKIASIGSVYTLTSERRKHYAQNLVYQVTKKVYEMGYMPMLYTDADYCASNSCYEKIGYILRGKLCTISAQK